MSLARCDSSRTAAFGRLTWVLAFAQLVSWGTLYYGFAVLITPMQQELGWSKTALNGAFSMGLIISGLCAVPVGAWIDRHGGRGIMTLGSALSVLVFLLWARVETLPGFFCIMALLGAVSAAVLYDPVFAVLARLFGSDCRPAIMTVTLVAGFASTVFVPVTEILAARLGWRTTLDVLALCNLAVCVGGHFLFLREARAAGAEAAACPEKLREHATSALLPLLRLWPFWGLVFSFTAYYLTATALVFHLIPLLVERQAPQSAILFCYATIGPMQVAGRLLLMAFGANVSARRIGGVAMLALPAAVVILAAGPSETWSLALFAGLYGLGNGIMTIVRGVAIPEFLGLEHYGVKGGAIAFPSNMAKALGPLAAAALWSVSRDYGLVLWAAAACAFLAVLGFWFAAATARPGPGEPEMVRSAGDRD